MDPKEQLDARLAPLAAGRAVVRVDGARASIILDVSGLSEAARDALAAEVESAARTVPGIEAVRE